MPSGKQLPWTNRLGAPWARRSQASDPERNLLPAPILSAGTRRSSGPSLIKYKY